jgi:hypothetical protein
MLLETMIISSVFYIFYFFPQIFWFMNQFGCHVFAGGAPVSDCLMHSAACGLPIHHLESVSFIATPSTTYLSHRKPASAVTAAVLMEAINITAVSTKKKNRHRVLDYVPRSRYNRNSCSFMSFLLYSFVPCLLPHEVLYFSPRFYT